MCHNMIKNLVLVPTFFPSIFSFHHNNVFFNFFFFALLPNFSTCDLKISLVSFVFFKSRSDTFYIYLNDWHRNNYDFFYRSRESSNLIISLLSHVSPICVMPMGHLVAFPFLHFHVCVIVGDILINTKW